MKRITQRDLRGLYEPAPESLYDGVRRALSDLPEGKGKKKVKRKISVGFILAAALVLASVTALAASRLNLFSSMAKYANLIVPLDGAEELVVTGLGSAENEWVTVTVEEAAYDGEGVNVLARIAPKEPERYALFNDFLMDAPKDEYEIENVPVPLPEGEQELTTVSGSIKVVNRTGARALYVNDVESPFPKSREAAEASGLPVYLDGEKLYYADQWEFRVTGRKDGRDILGFDTALRLTSDGDAADGLIGGMAIDAEAQSDGSVLVWFDNYADTPMPDAIDLKLTVRIIPGDESDSENEVVNEIGFTLAKSEAERTARYVPDGGGVIGDHVRVREVSVNLTKVRAYLTVDYDYEPRPEEDMGVWLHTYDAEGNAITTGGGSTSESSAGEALGFYRQLDEMQSFDDIPEIIVLEAKIIDGEPLGRCVCRLVEAE